MPRISTREAMLAAERAMNAGVDNAEMKGIALLGAFFELLAAMKGIESRINDQVNQHQSDIQAGETDKFVALELQKWKDAKEALAIADRISKFYYVSDTAKRQH